MALACDLSRRLPGTPVAIMTRSYVLECRLCEENTKTFDTTDAIDASEWTEASALGVIEEGRTIHLAFCPGHSLEQ